MTFEHAVERGHLVAVYVDLRTLDQIQTYLLDEPDACTLIRFQVSKSYKLFGDSSVGQIFTTLHVMSELGVHCQIRVLVGKSLKPFELLFRLVRELAIESNVGEQEHFAFVLVHDEVRSFVAKLLDSDLHYAPVLVVDVVVLRRG